MDKPKVSDLEIGTEYSLVFGKDSPHYMFKLFAIINDSSGLTELYGLLKEKGERKFNSTSLVYAREVGLGKNSREAKKNYGKLPWFEEVSGAYSSLDEAQKIWDGFLDNPRNFKPNVN